jgi:DNA polymerase III subunit delta'
MPFADLVGNAAIVARLSAMVRSGKVPPSMIFSGRAGVGKLQAAIALAQALNCREPEGGDSCGKCPACLRIGRDEHPDVRVLRPDGKGGQLKVEGVRDIVGQIPFRPFEGKHRVIVLVDAERMNPTTGNTLLKTLEEPPAWATLVLLTGNEASLLPTILSRCQLLRFSPLAPDALVELLVTQHQVERDRAILLAAVSGGGLTRALELQEEPLAELRLEALRFASVAAEGGAAEELVRWADRLSKESRLTLILDLLLSLVRDVAAKLGGALVLHSDLEKEIGRLAEQASLPIWLAAYSLAEEALVDLRDRYLNKRITLSRLLVAFDELSH